jgi:hypothetical protein
VRTLQAIREKWPVGIGATIALLVLFYILLPHVDRVRIPARESRAVGTLRNILLAQQKFRSQNGCFASKVSELSDYLGSLDDDYTYVIVPQGKDTTGCVTRYLATASPVSHQAKETRYFSLDQTETCVSKRRIRPGPVARFSNEVSL